MQTSRSVVLAFDSFKGSLTASEACRAAAEGVSRSGADPVECPLSDGGEGFVESISRATGGSVRAIEAAGPLFESVSADVGFVDGGRTAIVEAAQVCGLGLVPPELRSPLRTTSKGLGELLLRLPRNVSRVVVGLGGTATNDAGMGMLAALGWRFLDSAGRELPPVGRSLIDVDRVEPGARLAGIEIVAACDVDNPLFGPRGAAHVYAPQKGASPADVEFLDRGLRQFAKLVSPQETQEPGAGAAGGLGFALAACLGARFESGAQLAIRLADLPAKLAAAELCLTGEGRTDAQTMAGKLPSAVVLECATARIQCVCISGSLGPGWEGLLDQGCSEVVQLAREGEDLTRSFAEARPRLADAAERAARVYMFRGKNL